MRYSTLEIIQKTAQELGLDRPPIALSSVDTSVVQLLGFLTATCDELLVHNWSALINEHIITTEVGVSTYTLPSDFQRFVSKTEWNRSTASRLVGPKSSQQWQAIQSSTVGSIDTSFKVKGNKIILSPTPTSVQTIALEYMSAAYVIDGNTGENKIAPTQDSDRYVFDDRLLINGIKLKFRESAGLNTGGSAYDYQTMLDSCLSADSRGVDLSLVPFNTASVNLPEGNWNQ